MGTTPQDVVPLETHFSLIGRVYTKAAPSDPVTSILTYPVRDLAGDYVRPDGGDWSNYPRNPLVNWAHTIPVGRGKVEHQKLKYDDKLVTVAVGYTEFFHKASDVEGINLTKYNNPRDRKPVGKYTVDECQQAAGEVEQLVRQGIATGVSIEFVPNGSRGEAFWDLDGKSVLDGRPSRHFENWVGLAYAHARIPVNPGAKTVLPDDEEERLEKCIRILETGTLPSGGKISAVVLKAFAEPELAYRRKSFDIPSMSEVETKASHIWDRKKLSDRTVATAHDALKHAIASGANTPTALAFVGYHVEREIQGSRPRSISGLNQNSNDVLKARWEGAVKSNHRYAQGRQGDNYRSVGRRLVAEIGIRNAPKFQEGSTLHALHKAVASSPDDNAAHLAYADALSEEGHHELAALHHIVGDPRNTERSLKAIIKGTDIEDLTDVLHNNTKDNNARGVLADALDESDNPRHKHLAAIHRVIASRGTAEHSTRMKELDALTLKHGAKMASDHSNMAFHDSRTAGYSSLNSKPSTMHQIGSHTFRLEDANERAQDNVIDMDESDGGYRNHPYVSRQHGIASDIHTQLAEHHEVHGGRPDNDGSHALAAKHHRIAAESHNIAQVAHESAHRLYTWHNHEAEGEPSTDTYRGEKSMDNISPGVRAMLNFTQSIVDGCRQLMLEAKASDNEDLRVYAKSLVTIATDIAGSAQAFGVKFKERLDHLDDENPPDIDLKEHTVEQKAIEVDADGAVVVKSLPDFKPRRHKKSELLPLDYKEPAKVEKKSDSEPLSEDEQRELEETKKKLQVEAKKTRQVLDAVAARRR